MFVSYFSATDDVKCLVTSQIPVFLGNLNLSIKPKTKKKINILTI